MRLIDISVGMPKLVAVGDGSVSTAIFKDHVEGPVRVNELNLEGDGQADLRLHGGWAKAVYAYPKEHYDPWADELPETKLVHGNFGENLTTEGLLETEIFIGDQLRIGSAEFVVTQPRLPCYKLGIRFGRKDILRRFLVSRRTGFYLAVLKTGVIETGDNIDIISRDENGVSVDDIVRIFAFDKTDISTIERALKIEVLPESWKEDFKERF
jgi:MOSC domain-containing protein YiiM